MAGVLWVSIIGPLYDDSANPVQARRYNVFPTASEDPHRITWIVRGFVYLI